MTPLDRAKAIRLLLLDVDGVHTDGCIYYTEQGDEIVANCAPTVARHAHWQSSRKGGDSAFREAAEFLLDAQGKLDHAISPYLQELLP